MNETVARAWNRRCKSNLRLSISPRYEENKSNPVRARALQLLREKMPNIANSEILMVGDSMTRDLKPAKKMGLKTALSKYGQTIDETGTPDYELADFKDLINIV